ncbi:DUF882 domain-containing protein [Methylovirgula sp. 4M-Z18]|uniref:DUF882 domain-containing protein n=1 Tax=Methylovirgula sp. 4M-Z18 TaxID=2293567 RepID=UPI0011C022D3|nr:DUF882 domain-containing protein [Methylovirgula sp. 4M-Z18]
MALSALAFGTSATENAIANGDTRTLSIYYVHTKEANTITFRRDGHYDADGLEKLNWALRDWRHDEPTKMDPHLFDIVWEVYRESGSTQPIIVMSGYRSPETNAMLRHRSHSVAEHSQHILGKAMDVHFQDVPMSKIREIAMKMQRGGVGYYPTAGTPFCHIDAGGVRSWPRMPDAQLMALFPDGKTVHIPASGNPLPGYEEARAEIVARGDSGYVATLEEGRSKGIFAALFGGGEDDDEEVAAATSTRRGKASAAAATTVASADYSGNGKNNDGARSFFLNQTNAAVAQDAPAAPAPATVRGKTAKQQVPQQQPQPVEVAAQASAAPAAAPQPQPQAEPAATPVVADAAAPAAADTDSGMMKLVPMPPRRPNDAVIAALASLGNVPLPPSRPVVLASLSDAPVGVGKADAIAAVVRKADGLPAMITQGPEGAKRPAPQPVMAAMAYASAPGLGVPQPPVRPAVAMVPVAPSRSSLVKTAVIRDNMVASRLDTANFRMLTSPNSALTAKRVAAVTPTVGPIRSAAKESGKTLTTRSVAGSLTRFSTAEVLPAGGFVKN